jgi:tape measure domain-containing protein
MAQRNVEYVIQLRDKFTKNLKNANKTISQMEKNTSKLASTFKNFLPVLGAAGIGAGVKSIIDLGIEMEKTRVAFATFLKDGEKANKLISQLNEFANVTPFNNQEVIKSGRVLLAANIPAEQIRETLKSIGDVSAGANVPLTEMAAIYSKAMNKGRVQAEELNQLAERGVPILQTFAEMFGVSTQEVMKMGSEGKLTSDLLTQAFQKMTGEGGIFFNLMDKQSATLGGKISTLKGKFQLLGSELGENNESIKKLVDRLISLVDVLLDNQKTIEKLIKIAANALKIFVIWKTTMFLYVKAVKVATIANKVFRLAIVAQNRGVKNAIKLTKGLNTAMKANVIGLVVTALGFLVEKYIKFRKEAQKATGANNQYNESLKRTRELANKINAVTVSFENLNLLTKEQKEELRSLTEQQLKQAEQLRTDALLAIKTSKEYEKLVDLKEKYSKAENEFAKGALAGGIAQQRKLIEELVQKRFGLTSSQITGQITTLQARLKRIPKASLGVETKLDSAGEKLQKETQITSRSPKVININIQKLIENQTIETQNLTEGAAQIKKVVTEVVLDALNDTQLAYKAG